MLNKAILTGRMTKAPELKQTKNGKSVCSFTIAVDRSRDRKKTDFIPIVAWGKTAEFISQWFGKGDLITIAGRIEVRNYEDKNGNKRTATEIIAEEAFFGGSKNNGKTEEKPAESEQGGFEEVEDDPNDFPF